MVTGLPDCGSWTVGHRGSPFRERSARIFEKKEVMTKERSKK
jgi:hypothetical protein